MAVFDYEHFTYEAVAARAHLAIEDVMGRYSTMSDEDKERVVELVNVLQDFNTLYRNADRLAA